LAFLRQATGESSADIRVEERAFLALKAGLYCCEGQMVRAVAEGAVVGAEAVGEERDAVERAYAACFAENCAPLGKNCAPLGNCAT
jgi:hypothetical protein